MILEILTWIITGVALVGGILNARLNKYGYALWLILDTYLFVVNLICKNYPMSILFLAYLCITVHGFSKRFLNKNCEVF